MDEKGPWSQIRMAMLSIEADLERAWCVWAVSLWAVSGAPAAKKISLGGGRKKSSDEEDPRYAKA